MGRGLDGHGVSKTIELANLAGHEGLRQLGEAVDEVGELHGHREAIRPRTSEAMATRSPRAKAKFTRYASGLHEPLGLTINDGWLYATQRGEVTRMKDRK